MYSICLICMEVFQYSLYTYISIVKPDPLTINIIIPNSDVGGEHLPEMGIPW